MDDRSPSAGSRSDTIVVLPGDGIGPDVTRAATRVLSEVGTRFGLTFTFVERLVGGAAIDATGNPLPQETLDACRSADAVLLGAVGGPRWGATAKGARPEAGLLALRQSLGLFANVRPIRCHPAALRASPFRPSHLDGVDFVVVRELTGGIYFGEKRREASPDGTRAVDVCAYSVAEIERIVRVAADLARTRSGRLVSVDKANVLETSRLWRETATRVVATEFPDVRLTHMLVDTCALQLVQRPRDFDVIVTENMFGDILTDEAAALAGSIGLLPSASLGGSDAAQRGLYEPVHGSAPELAGRDAANPVGAILSVAMMLRYSLGRPREADAVERAVDRVMTAGVLTADLAADRPVATTGQVTDAVISALHRAPFGAQVSLGGA